MTTTNPIESTAAEIAPDLEQASAETILRAMRAHPLGRDAVRIGEVRDEQPGRVLMRTSNGSTRILDMLVGEPLPRIC